MVSSFWLQDTVLCGYELTLFYSCYSYSYLEELVFLTFSVAESGALEVDAIKYFRFSLIWLFPCFFLNSSANKTREDDEI